MEVYYLTLQGVYEQVDSKDEVGANLKNCIWSNPRGHFFNFTDYRAIRTLALLLGIV